MKINRYELSPAPTPQDLETLSFLQSTQRDREKRLVSLADGMTKLTAAIWNDLRELLTRQRGRPNIAARPFVELLLRQSASTQHLFLRWHEFAALPDSSTSDHRSCDELNSVWVGLHKKGTKGFYGSIQAGWFQPRGAGSLRMRIGLDSFPSALDEFIIPLILRTNLTSTFVLGRQRAPVHQ
jgi:hypothetical protein